MSERWNIKAAQSRWKERREGFARALRRAVSRDNLIADLKTLITVAPLTVLVWIYAEQQQLVTDKDTICIDVGSSDPVHQTLALLNPGDGTVQVTILGSQVGIDRVKAEMRKTILSQPLEIKLPARLAAGRQQVVALDQIAGNSLFDSQGVTVTACSPEMLTVHVDELVERQAAVVAPTELPGLEKAVFNPAQITMRGPETLLDDLARRGLMTVTADLDHEPTLSQPGEHPKLTVSLVPQAGITFLPDTVTADVRIGEANVSVAVSPVPVKVEASKWLMDNYKFTYKEWLTDPVTLIGPRQQISLINPENAKITAVVNLDNTDADFHGQRPVTFQDTGLPDGVSVKPEAAGRTIEIGIDPR